MKKCILRIGFRALCGLAALSIAFAEPSLAADEATSPSKALPISELPAGPASDAIMAPAAKAGGHGWANAAFQEAPYKPQLLGTAVPFSFQYGHRSSTDLRKIWKHTADVKTDEVCTRQQVTWSDPATGLEVRAVITSWSRYPAVEWVLYFRMPAPKTRRSWRTSRPSTCCLAPAPRKTSSCIKSKATRAASDPSSLRTCR